MLELHRPAPTAARCCRLPGPPARAGPMREQPQAAGLRRCLGHDGAPLPGEQGALREGPAAAAWA
eukprot:10206982-Lingulodinium_polyedra.AAC.1